MTLSESTDLTPETSDLATLRQAVEWVAFGLPPLLSPYDEVFRQEGNIRLMYCHEDSPKIQPICEAQTKLFIALRKGLLPATAFAIEEIEKASYDEDIPDFRKIKNISERQEISCTLWEYDRIFWSESCLVYDHPDGTAAKNNSWLLARFIWVDTSKLYELFPPKNIDSAPVDFISLNDSKKQIKEKHFSAKASNKEHDKVFKEIQKDMPGLPRDTPPGGGNSEEAEMRKRLNPKGFDQKYYRDTLRPSLKKNRGRPRKKTES